MISPNCDFQLIKCVGQCCLLCIYVVVWKRPVFLWVCAALPSVCVCVFGGVCVSFCNAVRMFVLFQFPVIQLLFFFFFFGLTNLHALSLVPVLTGGVI